MKGIILAGGKGTRLYPTTKCISKQLIPIYDKPTIYYPLSTLMLMDIREVAIISSPRDVPMIRDLLGDGRDWGMKLEYLIQPEPKGIAEAFIIAKDFIAGSRCCLILGDNFFYGYELPRRLRQAKIDLVGATIFAIQVKHPEQFGVVEIDKQYKVISLEEKPKKPKSNWAVTGLYLYDKNVADYAGQLKPSARGELEITDLNRMYLEKNKLSMVALGRGTAWLDTGTPDGQIESAQFVQTIENRQGLKIACLEEIALNRGFINEIQLAGVIGKTPASSYRDYLEQLNQN